MLVVQMRSWRSALMAGVSVAALGIVTPVAAQDAPPAPPPDSGDQVRQGDRPIEKVVVTGSRLRKDEFTSPSPVQIIDPRSAEKQGSVDTATTIQSSSVAAGSAQITSSISSAFVTNGGPGTQTVSLRGLGAERTLVLLNGRRAGPAGIRGAVGAFDLNVIPQSIVQSIEVLKDGASSVYGSDAVAGVVNIITRKDTDGLQVDSFYSQPFESGGEEMRLSGIWGTSFDGGHVQLAADYYKRNELKNGDRDYLRCPEDYVFDTAGNRLDLIDPRTNKIACRERLWGHLWLYDYSYFYSGSQSNLIAPNGQLIRRLQPDYGDNLGSHTAPLGPPADAAQLGIPAGYFPVGYDGPSYAVENANHPFSEAASLIPETERYTLFVEGSYDVTEAIELYGEAIFNRRKTHNNEVRQFWSFGFTSQSALPALFFGDPAPGDPIIPAGFTGDVLLSPTTITDWGDTRTEVDYYRVIGGARGELGGALSGWTWDVYGHYSRSDGDYFREVILDDAVDSQSFRTASCVGTLTPISNRPCIDIDWTNPEFLRGNFTPAERAFLFDTETGRTIYTQLSFEGSANGTLFENWAGPVDAALGVTWRRDEINDTPGPITLAGNIWGSSGSGITQGQSTTKEYFGEVDVPLLADVPFAKYFNVRLSGRYTDVNTVGGGDETYKVGGNWQVNEWLRFRGTYGTSFRAPHLFELFLADETGFLDQRVVDPCIQWGANLAAGAISQQVADNCAADGVPANHAGGGSAVTVVTGGGLGVLKPETSVAKSVSIVLTPNAFLPSTTSLSIAVDYFEIEVEGEITQLGANNIVGGCYSSDFFPNDPLCALFTRGQVGAPNNIDEVHDSFININDQTNRGIDVTTRLRQELPNGWGDLSILAQMTWQLEDDIALFEGTQVSVNGEDGEPIWVGDFNIEWSLGAWSVFWGIDAVQHTSDVADFIDANGDTCLPVPDDPIGPDDVNPIYGTRVCADLIAEARVYHAVSVTREFEDWRITLGIANLFDDAPPRVSVSTLASDFALGEITTIGQGPFTSNYDYVGRRGFLSVSKKF
jgi:iron complex outermembrane receptor protein